MGMKKLEEYRVDFIDVIKRIMATNLTNKGVSASRTESLQALADKIANVNTGKRYATGTGWSGSTGIATITGLGFTPSIVKVKFATGGIGFLRFLIKESAGHYGGYGKYLIGASSKIDNSNHYPDYALINDGSNQILSDGFKIMIGYVDISYGWEAWE